MKDPTSLSTEVSEQAPASVLARPLINACTLVNEGVRASDITTVRLEAIGWGWLRVTCASQPQWPGLSVFLKVGEYAFELNVPAGAVLELTFTNLLGRDRRQVSVDPVLWSVSAEAMRLPAPRIPPAPAHVPVVLNVARISLSLRTGYVLRALPSLKSWAGVVPRLRPFMRPLPARMMKPTSLRTRFSVSSAAVQRDYRREDIDLPRPEPDKPIS